MCFLNGAAAAKKVCLILLEWRFPLHGTATERLDVYEVTRWDRDEGRVFEAVLTEESDEQPQRRRRAIADVNEENDDDFDLLADLARRPGPEPAVVREDGRPNPIHALIRAAEGRDDDVLAQPLPEEVSDEEAAAQEHAGSDEELAAPAEEEAVAANVQPRAAQPVVEPAEPELPICDRGGWQFFSTDGQNTAVGRIHHLGESSLKATCKIHQRCACAISLPVNNNARRDQVQNALGYGRPPSYADIERDLKIWLAEGLACGSAQHAASSLRLRADRWRMKTRTRPAIPP